MSIRRGTTPSPNSLCKRSASACLRTEPNTRNPFETSTFVVPQPIPVETPVTTTSLLFAIAFLLRWITVHLQYLQWLPKTRLKRGSRELVVLRPLRLSTLRRRVSTSFSSPAKAYILETFPNHDALLPRCRMLPRAPMSLNHPTDRRIFISPSTMAKSLGTLSKSFEISLF